MTPAEELELLRLRKRKAMALQIPDDPEPAPAAPAFQEAGGPTPSALEALAAGAGQGALGLGDEIGAMFQASATPPAKGSPWYAFPSPEDQLSVYRAARNENRQIRDAAWEQQPVAYAAGYVPGMVGSLSVPMGNLASIVGKAKGAAPAVLRGILGGVVPGGVAALGSSDADNISGLGRDIGLGVLGGGLFGAGLVPISAAARWAAPKIAQFAYRQAVKATGPNKTGIKALLAGGRLEALGKKLMEMGVIPKAGGIEKIAEAAKGAANRRGADVGAVLRELDSLAQPNSAVEAVADTVVRRRPALGAGRASMGDVRAGSLTELPPALQGRPLGDFPGSLEVRAASGTVNQRVPGMQAAREAASELPGFNPYQVAQRAREELLNPLLDSPALKDLAPGLEQQIANLEAMGNRRIAFSRANAIKGEYDKRVNWNADQPLAKKLLKQLRGLVNEEIEKSGEAAAIASGNPELLGRFLSAKQDYGALRAASRFAKASHAGQEARGVFALPDIIAGAGPAFAALASGQPLAALGGLATAYGAKLARERGNAVAANAALGLSNLLVNPRARALAGRAATSIPGRRLEVPQTLLELLAPAMLHQSALPPSSLSAGRAARQGLGP